MERYLTATDPAFVRMFAAVGRTARVPARSMHAAGAVPCMLLAAGLVLMILGGVTAIAPVAVSGMALAAVSLFVAHTSTEGGPGASFA